MFIKWNRVNNYNIFIKNIIVANNIVPPHYTRANTRTHNWCASHSLCSRTLAHTHNMNTLHNEMRRNAHSTPATAASPGTLRDPAGQSCVTNQDQRIYNIEILNSTHFVHHTTITTNINSYVEFDYLKVLQKLTSLISLTSNISIEMSLLNLFSYEWFVLCCVFNW